MIGFISIYKKDIVKVKIEINHQTMKIIKKNIFKSLFLYMIIWLETVLKKAAVESVLIIYADKSTWQYHPIIVSITINYKEQIVIIDIKLDM